MAASQAIQSEAIDENGDMQIDLVTGVENYTGSVLFISSACNQIIGEEYQIGHMEYFANADMVVIEDAGHSMLGEKPVESLRIIREYFAGE